MHSMFFTPHRTDDMVDVISTRLQEVYGSLRMPTMPGTAAALRPDPVAERMSANALRRFGDEHRRRTAYNKEMEKQVRCLHGLKDGSRANPFYFPPQGLDSKVYELKETAPSGLQLPNKPVPGLSCRHCAPTNSVSVCGWRGARRDMCAVVPELNWVNLIGALSEWLIQSTAFICCAHSR